MKKINILLNLLIICSGVSVFDIKSAARSSTTKRGHGDDGEDKDFQKKPRIKTTEEEEKEEKARQEANRSFLNAVRNNNVEQAQSALEMGADVNAKDDKGKSAIQLILSEMHEGWSDMMTLLIESGADIKVRADNGDTVLSHFASTEGYSNTIELFLKHGADVNAQNGRPLKSACMNGIIDTVKVLLENPATKVNLLDPQGNTELMYVCGYGGATNLFEIVKLLLDHKVDVTIKNNKNETVLTETMLIDAYEDEIYKTAELLIKSGVDVNAVDNYNNTALSLAQDKNLTEVVKLLTPITDPKIAKENKRIKEANDILFDAVNKNNIERVEEAIKAGANINAQKKNGRTQLINASQFGRTDIVRLLLSCRPDVNIKDVNGNTALIWASANGHIDVVKLLLERKVDIDIKDNDGDTALIWAVRKSSSNKNCIEIVKLLLENNADVSITNKFGKTVLNYIAKKPNLQKIFEKRQEKIFETLNEACDLPAELSSLVTEYLISNTKKFCRITNEDPQLKADLSTYKDEPLMIDLLKSKVSSIGRLFAEGETPPWIENFSDIPESQVENDSKDKEESKEIAEMDTTEDGNGTKSAHLVIPRLTKK